MNIFAELWHSITSIKSYAGFVKQSRKRTFFYGLLVTTVYVMITTVVPMAVAWGPAGNIQAIVEMFIPDFKLEDGRLWVEKTIQIKQYDDYLGGIYVDIDTSREAASAVTDVDLLMFDHVLIADAEHLVTRYDGRIIRMTFKEMEIGDWTRATLLKQLFPYIKQALLYALVFLLLIEYAGFYLGAWFVACFGAIMGAILKYKISFREQYNLAVHARTPAIALKCICAWVPLLIPFFYTVNFGLSGIYVWRALLYMKEHGHKTSDN